MRALAEREAEHEDLRVGVLERVLDRSVVRRVDDELELLGCRFATEEDAGVGAGLASLLPVRLAPPEDREGGRIAQPRDAVMNGERVGAEVLCRHGVVQGAHERDQRDAVAVGEGLAEATRGVHGE